MADFLVLAILVNIAAYFAFIQPGNIYDAHEMGPVASFGAALTGRMLGGPLLRLRRASRQRDREPGPGPKPGPDREPRQRLPWVRRDWVRHHGPRGRPGT